VDGIPGGLEAAERLVDRLELSTPGLGAENRLKAHRQGAGRAAALVIEVVFNPTAAADGGGLDTRALGADLVGKAPVGEQSLP
jgi:hypothetical protein